MRDVRRIWRSAAGAGVVAALLGALLGGAHNPVTPQATSAASPTTSTSSTGVYLGAIFVNCDYSVFLLDAGSYGSINLRVTWNQYDECGPADDGPAQTATLSYQNYYDPYTLTGLPYPLDAGTEILQCTGVDLISKWDDPTDFDLTDVPVTDVGATDREGNPVAPPRLCVRDLWCDYEPYDFYWKPEPECGDANYNERRDVGDALIALKTAIGAHACLPVPASCDPDGDGVVTTSDALTLLLSAVGLPAEMLCPPACLL